jgi:hypothetical protein
VLADQAQSENCSIGVTPFKRLKQPRKSEPWISKLEDSRELQVARERAKILHGKLSVCNAVMFAFYQVFSLSHTRQIHETEEIGTGRRGQFATSTTEKRDG